VINKQGNSIDNKNDSSSDSQPPGKLLHPIHLLAMALIEISADLKKFLRSKGIKR
jgi:hypothetical protein